MNKRGQLGLAIVPIGVALIIGVIVVSIMFSQVSTQTSTTAVADDTFTAAASCTRVTDNCYIEGSTSNVLNSTGDDVSASVSECGDVSGNYGYTASGLAGTINVSYTEVDCGYISGLTATIVNYLPILLGVALIVFLAGFVALRP